MWNCCCHRALCRAGELFPHLIKLSLLQRRIWRQRELLCCVAVWAIMLISVQVDKFHSKSVIFSRHIPYSFLFATNIMLALFSNKNNTSPHPPAQQQPNPFPHITLPEETQLFLGILSNTVFSCSLSRKIAVDII